MADADELSCVRCGACCIADYDDVDYVHLTEDDFERLTEREQRLLTCKDDSDGFLVFRFLRTTHDRRGNCRCKALRGTIGTRVACSIYERRPIACRRFEQGSTVCLIAREANRINGVG